MTILLSIFVTYLEFLCLYLLGKRISRQSLIPTKTDIIFCLLYLLFVGSPSDAPSAYLLFISQTILICYFLYSFSSTIVNKLLLYTLSFAILTCIQFFLIIILGLFNISFPEIYNDLMGNLCTILLLFLLLFFPWYKIYCRIIHSALPYRIIILNTYFIFFSLLFIAKIDTQILFQTPLFLLCLLTLLLAANFCILFYEQRISQQEQKLRSFEQNQPIYASLINDIRANQHEYSNRLQHLENLPIICKDYDSLCKALSSYTQSYKKPIHAYPLLRINMPLLAASLYNLYCQAATLQITIQFDVITEQLHSVIPEYELTDYFCILTQNAIEACTSGDTIYIHISSKDNKIKFIIRNPTSKLYTMEEINTFFHKGYSTKNNDNNKEHGYGLYHLVTNIKKKNGTISADCIPYDNISWIVFELEI